MYVIPHFRVQELLHPRYIEQFGLERCKRFLETNCQPRLLTLSAERQYFNVSMTINDWHRDGQYKNSGTRYTGEPLGSNFSPHYGFQTDDIKYDGLSTDEVLTAILAHPEKFPLITRIENIEFTRTKQGKLGHDWFHRECGLRLSGQKIKVFRP